MAAGTPAACGQAAEQRRSTFRRNVTTPAAVPLSVYIGIDVACGTGKRLPVCVVSAGDPLLPLAIPPHLAAVIPRGVGNREIVQPLPFQQAARDVVAALRLIVEAMDWRVERIAIDASAAPPETGSRLSEIALGRHGLALFRTPAAAAWPVIRQKCVDHLAAGGRAATLPHANKLWMLFGFALFICLRTGFSAEVIEVYPFAIVRAILAACQHKSTEQGYRDQLAAVAGYTGWEPLTLESRLRATVAGTRHDRLDAFMAAWVASLPVERRRAFGNPDQPDDAIWVPCDLTADPAGSA